MGFKLLLLAAAALPLVRAFGTFSVAKESYSAGDDVSFCPEWSNGAAAENNRIPMNFGTFAKSPLTSKFNENEGCGKEYVMLPACQGGEGSWSCPSNCRMYCGYDEISNEADCEAAVRTTKYASAVSGTEYTLAEMYDFGLSYKGELKEMNKNGDKLREMRAKGCFKHTNHKVFFNPGEGAERPSTSFRKICKKVEGETNFCPQAEEVANTGWTHCPEDIYAKGPTDPDYKASGCPKGPTENKGQCITAGATSSSYHCGAWHDEPPAVGSENSNGVYPSGCPICAGDSKDQSVNRRRRADTLNFNEFLEAYGDPIMDEYKVTLFSNVGQGWAQEPCCRWTAFPDSIITEQVDYRTGTTPASHTV